MHTRPTLIGLALLSLTATLTIAGTAPPADAAPAQQSQRRQTASDALSVAEEADIRFMREEEKLARDVYTSLYALWSRTLFANIAASEQTHMDSMAKLIASYELDDPVRDDRTGGFSDPALASLYVELTARGQTSSLEALYVGAYIEEVDMRDIQAAIARATHADIVATYENLLRGSRNHLRAFVRAIETGGVVYEAQVLPQAEVDAIVDSPLERGR